MYRLCRCMRDRLTHSCVSREQYTVRTAMRWIVERESWTIFERESVLNGMLADLVVGEAQARKRVKLALASGAGRQLCGMLRKKAAR